MSKKIAIISLGCDKNRVDTENMLYYLSHDNYEIVYDYSEANIIIVNTCAFIESARAESIDTILEMAQYKKGKCEKLIVTGCLPEKYRNELEKELPEVDAFLGVREYEKICNVIEPTCPISQKSPKRIMTTPQHFAYLRIADGCNNFCTFCTIPSIRGKYKSRTIEDIMQEAESLVNFGVQELILVAQDVTYYGKDIYGELALVKLIKQLSTLNVKWIRLMYCYPEIVTDELINEIATNDKVAKYIDIPLQHIDDKILKLMNRRTSKADIINLINKLRTANKDIAIRTTLMVGFPGETDTEFNNLCEFVKSAKLDNIGIFAYSKEEDTASAKLPGHLTSEVKEQRVNILGEIHLQNVRQANKKMIGKTVEVLYEDIDYDKNLFIGRIQQQAPDVDGIVYFTGDFVDVGNYYKVKITKELDYDLYGEKINEFTN